MTWEQGSEQAEIGDRDRQDSQLAQAGDSYTRATYEYLGESGPIPNRSASSHGLQYLSMAALCYRLDDRSAWCQNRCRQGVLFGESIAERAISGEVPSAAYESARRGAWYEYIGDFRVIGELDDANDAYEMAMEVYRDATDPKVAVIEQEHMRLIETVRKIAKGVESAEVLTELARLQHHADGGTLTEWVEFKQDCLPTLIEQLEIQGTWDYEDAT